WQDVFVCAEKEIKGVQLPVGPTVVEVGGRVDDVRFHPKYHLEVVDYKLSQGTQQKLDMVQLAIYAHLLPLWRPGCSFCGTLEYYLPNFMEIPVSPKQLADIYVGLVEPVLYEMFAKGSKPAPATPKSKPAQATPERDRSHAAAEVSAGSDLATKVVAAFGEFNLSVEAVGVVEGPQVRRIKLKPVPGVKVASLMTRAADLRVKLALDATPGSRSPRISSPLSQFWAPPQRKWTVDITFSHVWSRQPFRTLSSRIGRPSFCHSRLRRIRRSDTDLTQRKKRVRRDGSKNCWKRARRWNSSCAGDTAPRPDRRYRLDKIESPDEGLPACYKRN